MKSVYGADRRVAFAGHLTLVGYYAQCQRISVPFYGPAPSVASWLTDTNPDLLVIHRKELVPGEVKVLTGEANRLGWETVSLERLPVRCRWADYILLAPRAIASPGQGGIPGSSTKR